MIFLNYTMLILLMFLSMEAMAQKKDNRILMRVDDGIERRNEQGHERGNGGDALVCRNNNQIQSVDLADIWERQQEEKLENITRTTPVPLSQIEMGESPYFLDQVYYVLHRLKQIDPRRANKYLSLIEKENFEKNFYFFDRNIHQFHLGQIDDHQYTIQPSNPNCSLERYGVQNGFFNTTLNRLFVIDKAYFDFDDGDMNYHRSSIILHEIVYQDLVQQLKHKKEELSNLQLKELTHRLRNYVALITSDKMNTLKPYEYIEHLEKYKMLHFHPVDVDHLYGKTTGLTLSSVYYDHQDKNLYGVIDFNVRNFSLQLNADTIIKYEAKCTTNNTSIYEVKWINELGYPQHDCDNRVRISKEGMIHDSSNSVELMSDYSEVIDDQIINFEKGHPLTFFDNGNVHRGNVSNKIFNARLVDAGQKNSEQILSFRKGFTEFTQDKKVVNSRIAKSITLNFPELDRKIHLDSYTYLTFKKKGPSWLLSKISCTTPTSCKIEEGPIQLTGILRADYSLDTSRKYPLKDVVFFNIGSVKIPGGVIHRAQYLSISPTLERYLIDTTIGRPDAHKETHSKIRVGSKTYKFVGDMAIDPATGNVNYGSVFITKFFTYQYDLLKFDSNGNVTYRRKFKNKPARTVDF